MFGFAVPISFFLEKNGYKMNNYSKFTIYIYIYIYIYNKTNAFFLILIFNITHIKLHFYPIIFQLVLLQ